MSYAIVVDLARNALMFALLIGGPLLAVALVVGLMVSVLQAATQIQEQTLVVVAKFFAVGSIFLILLPWLLQTAVKFTTEVLRSVPVIVS